MNRTKTILAVALVGMIALAVVLAASRAGAADRSSKVRGLFADLRVGQSVQIKDLGTVYRISTLPGDLSGNIRISELSETYLVIKDSNRQRRIPLHAVKCIVVR